MSEKQEAGRADVRLLLFPNPETMAWLIIMQNEAWDKTVQIFPKQFFFLIIIIFNWNIHKTQTLVFKHSDFILKQSLFWQKKKKVEKNAFL